MLKAADYATLAGAMNIGALRQLIGENNPLILEIGANVGQTTTEFLKHFPEAIIHCFEPEPRAMAKFKAAVNSPNVKLYETAIGNQIGTATFHQSTGEAEDWDQSGSILKPAEQLNKTWPTVLFKTKIEVPITKLDTWASNHQVKSADFIWADVQGAEADLILGAAEVLRSSKYFYTEYGALEWYEGQATLDQLSELLFPLGHLLNLKFGMDAFFVNQNLVDISTLPFPIAPNSYCPCDCGAKYENCHGKNFAGTV